MRFFPRLVIRSNEENYNLSEVWAMWQCSPYVVGLRKSCVQFRVIYCRHGAHKFGSYRLVKLDECALVFCCECRCYCSVTVRSFGFFFLFYLIPINSTVLKHVSYHVAFSAFLDYFLGCMTVKGVSISRVCLVIISWFLEKLTKCGQSEFHRNYSPDKCDFL